MNKQHLTLPRMAALGLMLASTSAAGQAGHSLVSFSTGIEYSSGTYGGTEDLEELYVPLTMRIDNPRFNGAARTGKCFDHHAKRAGRHYRQCDYI
jgi:hypothetical protein